MKKKENSGAKLIIYNFDYNINDTFEKHLDKKNVNTDLVKFLYKSLNEKKKLYLLSKHTGTDLDLELKGFRLSDIFDEVINIDVQDDKAKYIKSGNAIFIDDSNSERLNIKEKLGIPVFSPDMIDVLL